MIGVVKSDPKKTGAKKRHWAEFQEAGTLIGFNFLLGVHKVFGRKLFTVFLIPAILYFMLRRVESRRASLDFLTTHYHNRPNFWSRRPGHLDVFKHFMQFSQGVLDKLLAWSVQHSAEDIVSPTQSTVDQLHADPRGHLIIGSHHGNLEFCRGYLKRHQKRDINILLHDKHAANFVNMMRRINADSRMNVYQVDNLDIGTILLLKEKIDNGEWLFIAGDRVPLSGAARTTTVEFMGRPAPIPIGPYLLAKSLGCPVKLIFAYRENKKITLELLSFTEKLELPRCNREKNIQEFAQKFAAELERRCYLAPFQWFNFYNFWCDHVPVKGKQR